MSSSFRAHLAGEKSLTEFSRVVTDTESSFNDTSSRINRIEGALREDLHRADLAGMIRRIQDAEQKKFVAVHPSLVVSVASLGGGKLIVDGKVSDVDGAGSRTGFFGGYCRGEKSVYSFPKVCLNDYRREEAIETINETMEELRAEIY
jgi:hypothetical protein